MQVEPDDITKIANNLLKLNVYFESKKTKFIDEIETYETVCILLIT